VFETNVGIAALTMGFPLLLLLLVILLERIEHWMLMPDERAAAVSKLLEQVDEAEELEKAVALMMSEVADRQTSERPSKTARKDARGRAFRLARRRRA
jgi:hypothetical protein